MRFISFRDFTLFRSYSVHVFGTCQFVPAPERSPGRRPVLGKAKGDDSKSSTSSHEDTGKRCFRAPSLHHHINTIHCETRCPIYIDVALFSHAILNFSFALIPALRERTLVRMATGARLVASIARGPACLFPMAIRPGRLLLWSIPTVAGVSINLTMLRRAA